MFNAGGFNAGGGAGFDAGGGNFNSPGGFGTPQQSQEKRSRSRAQNLVPVTIAQLYKCTQEEDKFMSDDQELSQVTFVGVVRSVKEAATRLDYEIDDMTGPVMEVKQFVDNDENVPNEDRTSVLRENTYVRVMGHVRSFNGKTNVVAFHMHAIEDMNELTCHMLEVMQAKASSRSQGGDAAVPMDTTAVVGGGPVGTFTMANNLNNLQKQVEELIRQSKSERGMSVHEICSQLPRVSEKVVRDAVEFLSSEGHIYSTIDEDHYSTCDA